MSQSAIETSFILSAEQRASIEEHARRGYPDECCGVLLGRIDGDQRIVDDLTEMANEWDPEEQRRRFLITPDELMRVEKEARQRQLDILGFYHSHPDAPARPSEFDREHAWPWYIYPIVSVEQGQPAGIRAWQLRDDRSGYEEISIQDSASQETDYSTVEQSGKNE